MRQSTIITLGASVAFGVFAVVLARGWINDAIKDEYSKRVVPVNQVVGTPSGADMVSVIIVDADLNFGDVLTRDMLRVAEFPKDAVPVGAYETMNSIFVNPVQPTVVLRRMARNEAVLDYKISGPGARGSLSALINEGMRAVSVRVTDVSGVAGFVMPGDYVDVIYTRDEEVRRNGNNLKSDVLLQNVKVLGIDQDLNNDSELPSVVKTVTLEVSNVDAQKLHLAEDAGKLGLALRRAGDTQIQPVKTVQQQSILSNPQKAAPVRTARRIYGAPKKTPSNLAEITVFRGEKRDQVQVIKDPSETDGLNNTLAGG
ncbi:MAG: Flp pilus assembly protein CpaB [Hellea sp.]|nr:Flp pilus assembly protein CpaB [Hellea sp.]